MRDDDPRPDVRTRSRGWAWRASQPMAAKAGGRARRRHRLHLGTHAQRSVDLLPRVDSHRVPQWRSFTMAARTRPRRANRSTPPSSGSCHTCCTSETDPDTRTSRSWHRHFSTATCLMQASHSCVPVRRSTPPSRPSSEGHRSSSSVQNVGQVTTEALGRLYEHALGLAYPSAYEGFGLPPLDAMSLGCPVTLDRQHLGTRDRGRRGNSGRSGRPRRLPHRARTPARSGEAQRTGRCRQSPRAVVQLDHCGGPVRRHLHPRSPVNR